jgi:UDP-3-O-[3-hydroxymyristoyl] N-acetylglucosamine deacetylase
MDVAKAEPIEAHFRNVTNTQLATTLGTGAQSVSTVEHLLAALQGFGVDNLLVEVSGPEIPILDGSSEAFCRAIQSVGLEEQRAPRSVLRLLKRVEVKWQEKWAVAEPSSRLEIHASIDWDHPAIGFQEFHFIDGHTDFREISQARTFGFLKDVEMLKKLGLAKGGSLENAVVLDHALVLNKEGLRYPDEFVRHKVLDALGDLKLAGLGIEASFKLHRAGHDLHRLILSQIFKDPSNYEIVCHTDEVEGRENARNAAPTAWARLAV